MNKEKLIKLILSRKWSDKKENTEIRNDTLNEIVKLINQILKTHVTDAYISDIIIIVTNAKEIAKTNMKRNIKNIYNLFDKINSNI